MQVDSEMESQETMFDQPAEFSTIDEHQPDLGYEASEEPDLHPASESTKTALIGMDVFTGLEERVLLAVDLLRRERQARAEAEKRVEMLEAQQAEQLAAYRSEIEQAHAQLSEAQLPAQEVERLQSEVDNLRQEREQVRQRVDRLLSQLDALEL